MTSRDDLETLSTKELHERAIETARKRLDVGFLWKLVKALPVAEELVGDDERSKVDIVRPLALINDQDCRVVPVWDTKMLRHERLNCHRLRNTGTCTLERRDLERVAELTGHRPVLLDLDATLTAG